MKNNNTKDTPTQFEGNREKKEPSGRPPSAKKPPLLRRFFTALDNFFQKLLAAADHEGLFFKGQRPTAECLTKSAEEYQRAKYEKKRKKAFVFIGLCVAVLVLYILALVAGRDESTAAGAFVATHVFNRHNDGNRFALTLVYFVLGFVLINLAQFFIKLLGGKKSKRSQTIAALLSNLTKYIGYAVVIGILLSVWGVDAIIIGAVFAALSIAIGFGAQGLVGDLIAGLFLIFESAIQVGDFVTFDEFRGEVLEVGIRTTRLKSILGDVKVINNSELKAFVNMSMHRSLVVCDITIEYSENIERVEKIIKDNLVAIGNAITAINDGPWYKGLAKFSERGVVLKIAAKCDENDRMQAERDLNRELKLLFDKHNVKIAVPIISVDTLR
jgi:small conductance mechanosensitive channel